MLAAWAFIALGLLRAEMSFWEGISPDLDGRTRHGTAWRKSVAAAERAGGAAAAPAAALPSHAMAATERQRDGAAADAAARLEAGLGITSAAALDGGANSANNTLPFANVRLTIPTPP